MIPGELQHRLVVADLDKKRLKKIVRKDKIGRKRVWKLKDNETRRKFAERVEELVNVDS